jgi:putative addiction module component (TIGR02574 family)
MSLEKLEREVLKLKPNSRAKLAERLLESLENLSEEENELLWAQEALRRHEEIETGAVKTRSGKEVFRNARSRLQ